MKIKETFLFFYSWEELFKNLTPDKTHELLLALFAYEKRGEEYAGTDEMVRLLFSVMRPQLEVNARKYERTCAARAEAGRKGGIASAERRRKAKEAIEANSTDNEPVPEHEHEHEPEPEPVPVPVPDDDDDSPAGAPAVAAAPVPGEEVSSVVGSRYRRMIGGRMSRACREDLVLAERQLGTDTVLRAIDECSDSGHPTARYLRGILRNWRREGPGGKGRGSGLTAPLPQDDLAWMFAGGEQSAAYVTG